MTVSFGLVFIGYRLYLPGGESYTNSILTSARCRERRPETNGSGGVTRIPAELHVVVINGLGDYG
jgi:hypothetical protein